MYQQKNKENKLILEYICMIPTLELFWIYTWKGIDTMISSSITLYDQVVETRLGLGTCPNTQAPNSILLYKLYLLFKTISYRHT